MTTREATVQEKEELYEYLATICQGRIDSEGIKRIGEDAPIIVMEDYVIPENNFRGKVLMAYMPLPDAKSSPHVYYWKDGKITRAGGVPIK